MTVHNGRIATINNTEYHLFGSGRYFDTVGDASLGHILSLAPLLKEANVCLDIGANIGVTSLLMASMSGSGIVHAFEPAPSTFIDLSRTIEKNIKNGITLHNVAISDKNGSVTFRNLQDFSSGNSIILENSENSTFLQSTKVPSFTLDDYAEEHGIDTADIIKIDVEGFEIDVLEGGRKFIEKNTPTILLEFNHYCLSIQREMLPIEAMRYLRKNFSHIGYYDRKKNGYLRIDSDRKAMDFLRDNIVTRNVDDILCSNNPDIDKIFIE